MNYWKALFSPFKPFRLRWYMGKTQIGVPYFFPRKAVEDKDKPGYMKFVPLKVGFSKCGLGWKTKWDNTDYRYEWSPIFSFVFFGYQIAAVVSAPERDKYWEAWLYYERNTDKNLSKKERIRICMKEFPLVFTSYYPGGKKETKNYYKFILRKKYHVEEGPYN